MDATRFDHWTRQFAGTVTRRTTLGAGLFGALGALGLIDADARKNKRKRRKRKRRNRKKVKRNAFGCVNVGGFCKKDRQCCSGICQGKKDRKKCRAHDQTTCQAGQHEPTCGPGSSDVACTTSTGESGVCDTTTGNAGYCVQFGRCFSCRKDADCVPFCGPQAACIVCAGCPGQGGTACVGPSGDSCTFPPP